MSDGGGTMLGRAVTVSLLILGTVLGSCQKGDSPSRCGGCGMAVDAHPRWIAGVVRDDGTEQLFCSPACLTRWIEHDGWQGSAWVTDYYTGGRVPLDDAFFVEGSNVIGPMGRTRVPVKGLAAARQFFEDHGGTAIVKHDGTAVAAEEPPGEAATAEP